MRLLGGILLTGWVAMSPAMGYEITNGRITLTIDAPSTVLTNTDGNRVDGVTWVDSAGVSTANMVSNAVNGPFFCNDPIEFWGQSAAYPNELYDPAVVSAGDVAVFHPAGPMRALVTSHSQGCESFAEAVTTTRYILNTAPGQINSVKVSRTFSFRESALFNSLGVRPYMPRLPLAAYPIVKLPNAAGVVTEYKARACGAGCGITDWNGRWLADDTGGGSGMMIIRSTQSTTPALAVVDNDDDSASNVSSVVLLQPTGGWPSLTTEVEYLCFYDARSWTKRDQNNGVLPQGCQVK